MSETIRLIASPGPLPSPARTRPPQRRPLRVGAVQHRWHPDPEEHAAALAAGHPPGDGRGRRIGVPAGAHVESLLRHGPSRRGGSGIQPEELAGGPTFRFAQRHGARDGRAHSRVSLRAGEWRGRARLQHRDHRLAGRRARAAHAQASHPGHGGLSRGPLFQAWAARGPAVRAGGDRQRSARTADVLGPVVPRARARVQPRGRRCARVSDGDRL